MMKARNKAGAALPQPGPFTVRDCALVVLATGHSATSLRELRDVLLLVDPSSIYHHFWGRLLQPQFDEPEYSNDFASWAFHSLHDNILAERLSAIDPSDYGLLEELRSAIIDIIEIRLDDGDRAVWNQADEPFYFTRSQIVVFDARVQADTPAMLAELLPSFSSGSIFYHFIEARRRPPVPLDDFSAWLQAYGEHYSRLLSRLVNVDPFFSSLRKTQQTLVTLFKESIEARE
jgi:hypothetical protein